MRITDRLSAVKFAALVSGASLAPERLELAAKRLMKESRLADDYNAPRKAERLLDAAQTLYRAYGEEVKESGSFYRVERLQGCERLTFDCLKLSTPWTSHAEEDIGWPRVEFDHIVVDILDLTA